MRDPRPLAEEDGTSDFVKRALSAGRERSAENTARERVWAGLAAASAAGLSTASMASRGAASAGAKGKFGLTTATAKLLVVCGAVGVVVASATIMLWSSPKGSIPGPHASPTASAPAAPAASTPASPPPPQSSASSAAGPAPRDESAKPPADEARRASRTRKSLHTAAATDPERAGGLREEASMLRQVQTALASGDVETAQHAANETRRKFPNGKLTEERDALEVRIALASGDLPRAARLAGEFAMRYPDSPLRDGLEASTRQER